MSLRLNRSLCAAYLRLGRHRRFYAAQALLLGVPNSHRYGHSVNYEGLTSSSSRPSTSSTVRLDHSNAHDDTIRRTRSETQNGKASSPRNPLSPNNVDLYLASLDATKLEPTLSDIERCRPPRHSDPSTPQYEQDYNTLRDTLDRSFTKAQLRQFASLYNLPVSRSMRKLQYIENIIERQWRWPSWRDVEKMKKDSTEVSTKSFEINPSELFLILGKDGADLLQLSTKYNLRISLISDPLSLRAEGLRASLRQLTEHLVRLRAGIVEGRFTLPTGKPISSGLLQRISRLSGAFIENIGNSGTIRICVKNPRHLDAARRLATRAACQVYGSPFLSLYAPPPSPITSPVVNALHSESYILHPFSSPRSLPWTVGTGNSFRVRRVRGLESQEEDTQKKAALAGSKGQFLAVSGYKQDLKGLLRADHSLPCSDSTSTVITASFGHVLLTSPVNLQRMSLTSPLEGHLPQSEVLKWLHDYPFKSSFLPSLPYNLLTVTSYGQQYMHRLVYHSLQTLDEACNTKCPIAVPTIKIVKCEVVLPDPSIRFFVHSSMNQTIRPEVDEISAPDPDECGHIQATERSEMKVDLQARCWLGSEMIMNVMMPDRLYDVQFCHLNSVECDPGQEPKDLQNYLSNIQQWLGANNSRLSQPTPPLTITHDDETYVLHTTEIIRQRAKPIHAGNVPADSPTEVIVEDVLDLESEHQSINCQVICNRYDSEEAWNAFLGNCDRLTTTTCSRKQMDDWLPQDRDT